MSTPFFVSFMTAPHRLARCFVTLRPVRRRARSGTWVSVGVTTPHRLARCSVALRPVRRRARMGTWGSVDVTIPHRLARCSVALRRETPQG
jgi:hypothetical protein